MPKSLWTNDTSCLFFTRIAASIDPISIESSIQFFEFILNYNSFIPIATLQVSNSVQGRAWYTFFGLQSENIK